MMKAFDLKFSENWNGGKLNNLYFTTIRPHSPRAYRVGQVYNVVLRGQLLKQVICTSVVTFKLINMPNITAALDTGYDREESIKMIKTMYKNYPEKCQDDSFFDLVLLKTLKQP